MPHNYDHRIAMGPASRVKDADQYLHAAERTIEQARGVFHGLLREMEMMAHGTHDPTIQANTKHVKEFADRLDHMEKDFQKLIGDIDHFSKAFR